MHIINMGTIELSQPLTKEAILAINEHPVLSDLLGDLLFEDEWQIEVEDIYSAHFDDVARELVEVLSPLDYVLNGQIEYYGEYEGMTYIKDNEVSEAGTLERWKEEASDDDLISALKKHISEPIPELAEDIRKALEDKVNEVYAEFQSKLKIESGDISPMQSLNQDELLQILAMHIYSVLKTEM